MLTQFSPISFPKLSKPSPKLIGLAAAAMLGISGTTVFVVNRPRPMADLAETTVPVKAQDLTARITASGMVQPIQSVNLSPKTAGQLTRLYVEQGDRVGRGQIIAKMDDADLQAQLTQRQAQLAQAEAKLAQAQAGSRPEEIAQARSRLAQSQARLAEAQAGSRSEEIAQAAAKVEAAQAEVDLASSRAQRYQALAREGAESRDRAEEALKDSRTAQANLREAQRSLELLQNGTRSEEIAQAQAEVREYRQALAELQNGTRPEEVAQAQAEVAAARGELQAQQVLLTDTVIRAPFEGIVTQKYATEGAFVTPTTSASSTTSATSTSIVAIAKGLEVVAKVPEVDLGRIQTGQTVEIVADAYPDQVFKGQVQRIAPEAVVEQDVTSFEVRVALAQGQTQLQSGMNVDVTFVGDRLENALVVPTVAIATENGQMGVYVLGSENRPQFRPVTIGSTIKNQTQILSGLKPNERVFMDQPAQRGPGRRGL